MIQGLTRTGLGDVGTDENFLNLAHRYGFRSVDLDPMGLVERHGVAGTKELLTSHDMLLGAVLLPVGWQTTEEQFLQGVTKLASSAELLAQLGARCLWTYLLPSVDENPALFMARTVRRLRLCAQVLEAFRLPLALEFIGPMDLRIKWKHPLLWNLHQTLELIAAIDRPNVGLLVDSFHCHVAGHAASELLKLRPEQIVHAHLGDAREGNIETIDDNDRLYPGEGHIDLEGFLRALKTLGYQGIVAQEVLSPRPVVDSAESLLERSRRGFDKVFAGAGLEKQGV